jgi:5-methylcytosine-specific restriction endonuclease McrA
MKPRLPLRRKGSLKRAAWHTRRRRAMLAKPPREGSQRFYEKRLESLNARYVKMRDSFECVQCRADGVMTETVLDAGHIYPKGLFPGGKFLVENLVAQCRKHNTIHIDRPDFLMLWYQREHGPDALIALHEKVLAMPRKMSAEWLQEQIAEREKQIEELDCHLAAMV